MNKNFHMNYLYQQDKQLKHETSCYQYVNRYKT